MASAPLNWIAKIGGDVLTTTAQTISAAINELVTSIGTVAGDVSALSSTVNNLSGDDIAYDNTVSQFTATNMQDAIDEIDGMIGDVESLLAAL